MRIDAKMLLAIFVSGANALDNNKDAINNMNVFPVPDGDTGINMTLTLSAVRKMNDEEVTTLKQCAQRAQDLIMRSARGNSGAILSLFFRGFYKALKYVESIGVAEMTIALRSASEQAYRAVQNPAEGTILTVMRRCAEAAENALEERKFNDDTFVEFFAYLVDVAQKTLDETPEMLPVLKEVGVVDAGGCGFVTMLNGMLAALREDPVELIEEEAAAEPAAADFSEFDTSNITFPYCTECVLEKSDAFYGEGKADAVREFVCTIGDSVVFIEDESIIKLHVHTDHPGLVLEKVGEYGMFASVKIENMRNQHSALVAGKQEEKEKVVEPTNDYGFVSVCMGEGITATFRDLGADNVIHGGQTMNPSTQDIIDGIRMTPAKTVFVLPNNKNIYLVALQAAKLVKDRHVEVLNTKSVPQGISAMISFSPEASLEENLASMNSALESVTSMSITHAIRNTTIDGEKIENGQMLGLMNGSIECVADSTLECLEMLCERMTDASFITLFYGSDVSEELAKEAEALVQSKNSDAEIVLVSGGQPLYEFVISVE
ncbi:MAG: DAK2 domain-containing protein [Clostridia bacterium]|nr:DAK2 domain-containing protein [Clostridia bacterium]